LVVELCGALQVGCFAGPAVASLLRRLEGAGEVEPGALLGEVQLATRLVVDHRFAVQMIQPALTIVLSLTSSQDEVVSANAAAASGQMLM
jgi:hypothetical protein